MTPIAAAIVRTSVGGRPKSSVVTKRLAPSAMPQAGDDADGDEHHRLAHHEPQHVAALRAERHADADLVRAARDAVGHQAEQADRREQQRQAAEQRVGLREHLLLQEPPLDLLDLRRHVHQRQVRIDLPDRFADCARSLPSGSPAVRTSNTALPTRVCRYGTYIVGGAASRTLSYFASRRTPTISSWLVVSMLDPKCWPIGFSFGKYFRAAASLMTTTFGAVVVVAIGEAAARAAIGMPIISKKFGETTRRLMLLSRSSDVGGVDAPLHEDARSS